MDCEQLLAEFLKEYPEYESHIRYQDDVPFVGWTGLRVFLEWIRRDHYPAPAMMSRLLGPQLNKRSIAERL